MIDIDLQLSVSDRHRRFDLGVRFSSDEPFTALYGPSGSGKSLTLQAIAGLLRPRAGHVRINGQTLFDAQAGLHVPAPARRVGYLFQDYALFPHLTVRQNVGFGLTSWRHPRLSDGEQAQVQRLLDAFELAALADSHPRTLSGGQQQRVALARALACKPQILLLDEPFAALNAMLRGTVRQDLARVCREWNIPVLMITHDIEDVLELADTVFVYQEGQVRQQIDLRDGSSREFARHALNGQMPAERDTGLRLRMRELLRGAASTA